MKIYGHLPYFLERWTVFKWWRLHIRIHHLIGPDRTPFLHSHPFWYVSIILSGDYIELYEGPDGKLIRVKHGPGSIIVRRPSTFHRIEHTSYPKCRTLFITWERRISVPRERLWDLKRHPDVVCRFTFKQPSIPGVYQRTVNGNYLYAKFDQFWYVGNTNLGLAQREYRLSIHQVCDKWWDLQGRKHETVA